MLFVEGRFFFFFLIVFAVHWALRSNDARKVWLLICSHVFYACFFLGGTDAGDKTDAFPVWAFAQKVAHHEPLPTGWWFPLVLIGSTIMDYIVGLGIGSSTTAARRRAWLFVSLAVNLGVLGFFKYYNFFAGSASSFLTWLGLPAHDWTLRIFLPYGISFYTFQSMSYSIEVYRRRLEPVRKFLDLAFFIAFFPQLVAGPIVRAMDFLPQVVRKRRWADVDVRSALTLFYIGFVKKACISEMVAPVADKVFANPGSYNVYSVWMGVLFYAIQIYCDFSGYTDMAIATARLLGYELTINFRFPYLAHDISDFWRRWHISLSTWLRDYLYIPLGGSRGSRWFTHRNLMITMLLGGLWHGASWNFVIWGGLHGGALVFHREWARHTQNAAAWLKAAIRILALPLTFYWICVTWVFFRSNTVIAPDTGAIQATGSQVARTVLSSFVLFQGHGEETFSVVCLWLFLGLATAHWLCSTGALSTWWRRIPSWAYAALLGVGTALAALFITTKYKPFIYFQF